MMYLLCTLAPWYYITVLNKLRDHVNMYFATMTRFCIALWCVCTLEHFVCTKHHCAFGRCTIVRLGMYIQDHWNHPWPTLTFSNPCTLLPVPNFSLLLSIDIRYSEGDFLPAANGGTQRFLSFSRSSLGKVGKNSVCWSL